MTPKTKENRAELWLCSIVHPPTLGCLCSISPSCALAFLSSSSSFPLILLILHCVISPLVLLPHHVALPLFLVVPFPTPLHRLPHCIPPHFVGRLYHSGYSPHLVVCSVVSLGPPYAIEHYTAWYHCWAGWSSLFASGFATAVSGWARHSRQGSFSQRCAALIVVHYDGIWGLGCCRRRVVL